MKSRHYTQSTAEREQDMRHTMIASITQKLQCMDLERLKQVYRDVLKSASIK